MCTCFYLDSCSHTCCRMGSAGGQRAQELRQWAQELRQWAQGWGSRTPALLCLTSPWEQPSPCSLLSPAPLCSLHTAAQAGDSLQHTQLSWAPRVAWQGSEMLLYSHYLYPILWVTTFRFTSTAWEPGIPANTFRHMYVLHWGPESCRDSILIWQVSCCCTDICLKNQHVFKACL